MTDQNTPSISELQQQANNGNAQAQFDLALCYADGRGDVKLALEWIIKAAEQGLIHAQCALGLYYLLNRERGEILNKIFPFCIMPGLIKPMFRLAWIAIKIEFCDSNDDLAFTWNKKAAEQGCAEAQYWLAYCYDEGLGVNQNDKFAFEWFKKSAEQNIAESKYWLAQYYLEGKGVQQSNEFAFKWFFDVVEQTERYFLTTNYRQNFCEALSDENLSSAYLLLGDLYIGKGIPQNHNLAFECYEKISRSHENGIQELRLARCYEFGLGVEQNMTLAGEYYRSVAEKGYSDAETLYRFAMYYLQGVNVEKNYELGMEFMINLARQGHKGATDWLLNAHIALAIPSFLTDKDDGEQYYKYAADWCLKELDGHNATEAYLLLGVLYYSGKGVEQCEERAIRYFEKAEKMSYGDDYPDELSHNQSVGEITSLWVGIFYAQGRHIATYYSPKQNGFRFYNDSFSKSELELFAKTYIEGIVGMPFYTLQNNKIFLTLLRISILKKAGEYELAKEFTQEVFDKTDGMDKNFKEICLTSIEQEQQIAQQNQELEEKNKLLQASQIELEDMMSMFAHKFRSPLDAIIYNTQHDNQIALYTEAAQTMRGLLNIFSIISTDADLLKDKIKQDYQGSGNLEAVFSKTIDMILLHLLSVSGAEKIQQHYLNYAKSHGHCDTEISYKTWCEEYFELEQAMQTEWETSYAQLLKQSPTLEQRLTWLEKHFFKLEIIGFDRTDIQFKEYGTTESFLTILLNEILVNVFKYYSSTNNQHVTLEWSDKNAYQALICHNPSIRSERTIIKGSHKGHVFLSTLARKTNSLFEKPIPQDNFFLEFDIPNELLISK